MKVEIPAVGEVRGVLHDIGFRELDWRWGKWERDW